MYCVPTLFYIKWWRLKYDDEENNWDDNVDTDEEDDDDH